jgi:hypothetical protein
MTVAGALMVVRSGITFETARSSALPWASAAVFALGVFQATLASIPTGGRLVPVTFMLAGAVALAATQGWISAPRQWWVLAGSTLVAAGLSLVLRTPVVARESIDPVRTVRALLLSRRVTFTGAKAPAALRVLSAGAVLTIDLSEMHIGAQQPLEVSVTALAARVDIKLPPDWLVVPGRLLAGETLRLEGRFDDGVAIAYLGADERARVKDLASAYGKNHGPWAAKSWSAVLNVSGSLSVVTFSRG